jgi:hypothetical protein
MRGYYTRNIKSLKINLLHITTAVLINLRIQIKFTLILLQRYPGREDRALRSWKKKKTSAAKFQLRKDGSISV